MSHPLYKWTLTLLFLAAGRSVNAQIPVKQNVYGREMQPLNMQEIRDSIGYPVMAQLARAEGIVKVNVLVDPYGKYRRHEVEGKAHATLVYAVERHVRHLVFPRNEGSVNWKDPDQWIIVSFEFRLAEIKSPFQPVPEDDRIHLVKATIERSSRSYSVPRDFAPDGCKMLSSAEVTGLPTLNTALEARKMPDFPGDELLLDIEIVISEDGVIADIVPVGQEGTAIGAAVREALARVHWSPMEICLRPLESTVLLQIKLVKVDR